MTVSKNDGPDFSDRAAVTQRNDTTAWEDASRDAFPNRYQIDTIPVQPVINKREQDKAQEKNEQPQQQQLLNVPTLKEFLPWVAPGLDLSMKAGRAARDAMKNNAPQIENAPVPQKKAVEVPQIPPAQEIPKPAPKKENNFLDNLERMMKAPLRLVERGTGGAELRVTEQGLKKGPDGAMAQAQHEAVETIKDLKDIAKSEAQFRKGVVKKAVELEHQVENSLPPQVQQTVKDGKKLAGDLIDLGLEVERQKQKMQQDIFNGVTDGLADLFGQKKKK